MPNEIPISQQQQWEKNFILFFATLHLNLLHLYNSPWYAIMHIVQIQYNTLLMLRTRKQSLNVECFQSQKLQ